MWIWKQFWLRFLWTLLRYRLRAKFLEQSALLSSFQVTQRLLQDIAPLPFSPVQNCWAARDFESCLVIPGLQIYRMITLKFKEKLFLLDCPNQFVLLRNKHFLTLEKWLSTTRKSSLVLFNGVLFQSEHLLLLEVSLRRSNEYWSAPYQWRNDIREMDMIHVLFFWEIISVSNIIAWWLLLLLNINANPFRWFCRIISPTTGME